MNGQVGGQLSGQMNGQPAGQPGGQLAPLISAGEKRALGYNGNVLGIPPRVHSLRTRPTARQRLNSMSRRGVRILCVTQGPAIYVLIASALAHAQNATPETASRILFGRDVVPLLTKHCLKCHSGQRPKGQLALDKLLDEAVARKYPETWDKIQHNLRSGDMPPSGRPKPAPMEVETITGWIDGELAALDCSKQRNPGRVTIRRLNRVEYKNTIRDLLGIDFKPADDFPTDDVGYGFDNIGDVLTLSPLLLERYLDAADSIIAQAFKNKAVRERIVVKPKETNRWPAARQTVENFARRAFRRPVAKDEVDRLVDFVRLAVQNGQEREQGLQLALKAALVSPHFLFRVELERSTDADAIYPISEYELASRLSYFLWSSMPDDELFRLAASNGLRKDLESQTRRMLRDPKAKALAENFAGQWLNLRLLKESNPDPKRYPAFNDALRNAMRTETELFFATVVKEDRSILDFLDADFTFVNEPLARLYGIPNIMGKEFQRVKLTGDQRGGVITQASVLTVTSNPTRTSLVKRGKWILENILGTPPPPPVPEAGELPEGNAELKGSLRQRMEMHRAKPLCASCHQRMDPLGFALENYDPIGAWRTRDGKFPIDSKGTLPNGQSFNGSKEMRAVLLTRQADFRKCLAEKMLTYALGRGLEFYDRCTVKDICQEVSQQQNRFSSLVVAIVKSDPFQLRKGKGGK
jgi:hypothetical protein